jgi:predicted dehydrogenase
MKRLRVGVIGLGVGRGHVRGYQGHPQADVVALADPDTARLEEIGNEYGVSGRYTDARDMLEKEQLDVVSVATPNKFHMPLAVAALEAGCHVLCEKPMAMNAAEGQQMLDAATKAGRRLMINFSYRFTDHSWVLKKQVDDGFLGEVYFARTMWMRRIGMPKFGGWFGSKEMSGGGPLIDLGVHRIDLALWLMGYPEPEYVLGRTYNPIAARLAREQGKAFDVEDMAAAFVTFSNGASMEITASWASHIAERELMETRVLGTDGGLVQRNRNGTYEFEAMMFEERNGCHFDVHLAPPFPSPGSSMYHFIECIVNETPHTATGEEGLIVMKLLDAIYQSAAEGKPVHVNREVD